MNLLHAFLHAHITIQFFFFFNLQSLWTRFHAQGSSTKRKGVFLSLFVSRFYIGGFCLQLIIDVELNSNWRQKEKLRKKKKE